MNEVLIQVRFIEETEFGQYQDALYYSFDEWGKISDKDIEQAKIERINNWVDMIKNPPPLPEPTKEELEISLINLESLSIEIENQKNIIQQKIVEISIIDPEIIKSEKVIISKESLADGYKIL